MNISMNHFNSTQARDFFSDGFGSLGRFTVRMVEGGRLFYQAIKEDGLRYWNSLHETDKTFLRYSHLIVINIAIFKIAAIITGIAGNMLFSSHSKNKTNERVTLLVLYTLNVMAMNLLYFGKDLKSLKSSPFIIGYSVLLFCEIWTKNYLKKT